MTYQNPIIPGFYPDPSICRVGEDYYLVNSSFEFFPGVPLFHSRDLIHWEQLGYVLTRPSQLPLDGARTSGGIFAPTIRYHGGRFYMVTTNVSHGGNFYVWTDDIRGEWSDPIYVDQGGIDPSIFWDEDGTVYFASTFQDEEGKSCIGQSTIDIVTGKRLTETRCIWHGTGGKAPEGPHMYRIGDYYYLMIAEGGTEYGHMETIARSNSPWGPYEGCPHNPILTHRDSDTRKTPFQGLGHADLVETSDGNWFIVFHAIRPTQFMLHHLGRETMIAPLTWDKDGWPVINEGKLITAEMSSDKMPAASPVPQVPNVDTFSTDKLSPVWSFLRNPNMENYGFGDGLLLHGTNVGLEDISSPTALLRRQQHFEVRVEASLLFEPPTEESEAGLTVFHTAEHHYDLVVTRRAGRKVAFLRRRVADILVESDAVELPESGSLQLRIDCHKNQYDFSIGAEGEQHYLGSGSTQLLSTECMVCTFTGCFVGVFAVGEGTAKVVSFGYTPE